MVRVFVMVIVILACATHNCDSFTFEQRLRNLISHKCLINSHYLFQSLELSMAASRLEDCIPKSYQNDNTDTNITTPQIIEEFCQLVSEHGERRISKFNIKLKPCLAEEEAFLTDMISSIFNASFEQICGTSRVQTQEVIDQFVSSSCNSKTTEISDLIVSKCISETAIMKDQISLTLVLNKSTVCGDLIALSQCAVETVKELCFDDDQSWKNANVLIEPYLSWCNENASQNDTIS